MSPNLLFQRGQCLSLPRPVCPLMCLDPSQLPPVGASVLITTPFLLSVSALYGLLPCAPRPLPGWVFFVTSGILKHSNTPGSPGELVKTQITGLHPQTSRFSRSGVGLRICVSKFAGDAAAGLGPTQKTTLSSKC